MAVGMVTFLDAAHLGPPECNDRVVRANKLQVKSHVYQSASKEVCLFTKAL